MIVVFNSKGGVGKSALSYSIASDLGYPLISNEKNHFLSHHPRSKLYADEKMPIEKNTVYDLGGFVSLYTYDVLSSADTIVVPTTSDFNAMQRAVEVLEEFKGKRIILVANNIEDTKEFEVIKSTVKKHFDVLVYPLKHSKIFKRSLESGMSLTQLYEENGLSKYTYRGVYKQYEAILKSLNS